MVSESSQLSWCTFWRAQRIRTSKTQPFFGVQVIREEDDGLPRHSSIKRALDSEDVAVQDGDPSLVTGINHLMNAREAHP